MTARSPAQPFGYAELRAGEARAVIVPALGGKIVSLQLAGREWLWRGDSIERRPSTDGASFLEFGASGGYDECFPTIAPCTLPSGTPPFGALALPDHGELWSQPSTFSLETHADGMSATTEWRGRLMPYRFARTVFVGGPGRVEMRYSVANEGTARIPFVWAAHAVFPLAKSTRVVFPADTRARVSSQHGIELGGPELRWPRAVVGGKFVDMSLPHEVARAYGCKLFLEPGVGRAAIEEDGATLEVTFDTAQVPYVGLRIDKRGWSPLRRRRAYRTLAFGPCIGAPDSLSEALRGWRKAAWLEVGERREWTVVWEGEREVRGSRQQEAGG